MHKFKKILFLCVENVCCSQLTDKFLKIFAPQFDVINVAAKSQTQFIPNVVDVVKDIGIDATQNLKELTNEIISKSITFNIRCANRESYPALFVESVVDWNISDTINKDVKELRKICAHKKHEVLDLIANLEKS